MFTVYCLICTFLVLQKYYNTFNLTFIAPPCILTHFELCALALYLTYETNELLLLMHSTVKGHYVVFSRNFNVYNINEVKLQTKKSVFFS